MLRIEDFEGTQLRIDEALKERQKGEDRIGETKTKESDNYVPVPPDLAREIAAWIAGHPDRNNRRAFLFPNSPGNAVRRGQLSEAASETVSGEGWDPRSYSSGIPAHLFHAHSGVRERQGSARSPSPYQSPNDAETLHESDPREPACCGCGSRREHRRRGERVQTTQRRRHLSKEASTDTKGQRAASKRVVSIDAWRKRT